MPNIKRDIICSRQKLWGGGGGGGKKWVWECSFGRKDEGDKGNTLFSCALWVCLVQWPLFYVLCLIFKQLEAQKRGSRGVEIEGER